MAIENILGHLFHGDTRAHPGSEPAQARALCRQMLTGRPDQVNLARRDLAWVGGPLTRPPSCAHTIQPDVLGAAQGLPRGETDQGIHSVQAISSPGDSKMAARTKPSGSETGVKVSLCPLLGPLRSTHVSSSPVYFLDMIKCINSDSAFHPRARRTSSLHCTWEPSMDRLEPNNLHIVLLRTVRASQLCCHGHGDLQTSSPWQGTPGTSGGT